MFKSSNDSIAGFDIAHDIRYQRISILAGGF